MARNVFRKHIERPACDGRMGINLYDDGSGALQVLGLAVIVTLDRAEMRAFLQLAAEALAALRAMEAEKVAAGVGEG